MPRACRSSQTFSFLFVVLLCCCFIPSGEAKLEEYSFTTSGQRIKISDGFGSRIGGTLNVSLSVTPISSTSDAIGEITKESENQWFYFVIFTETQYKNILYYNTYDPCTLASFMRVEFQGSFNQNITLPFEDYYHAYLINCDKHYIQIETNLLWLQPDGERLSYEQIPLLWCNISLLVACFLTAMMWMVCLLLRRNFIVRLHILLLTFILLEIAYYAVSSGIVLGETSGSNSVNDLISVYLPLVLNVTAETLFISCLLLLSTGWSILTLQMGLRSKQLLATAILLYGGFYFAYSLCSNTENLRAVYELFFYVIKFLILFAGTIALNAAGEFLRSEFSIHHPQRIFIAKKIMLFRQLRWMFLVLLLIPIFMVFMDFTILTWQERWLTPTVNGWILLITFWTVSYSIRPRPEGSNYYFLIHHMPPEELNNRQQQPQQQHQVVGPNSFSDSDTESDDDNIVDVDGIEMQVFSGAVEID